MSYNILSLELKHKYLTFITFIRNIHYSVINLDYLRIKITLQKILFHDNLVCWDEPAYYVQNLYLSKDM